MSGDFKYTFSKSQRLKSRKKIQEVFAKGQPVYNRNIKLLAIVKDAETGMVQCGVGTNSRQFKKAVDRNRIKRLLREAYRLQQQHIVHFSKEQKKNVSLFFLYRSRALPVYKELYEDVGVALQKLITQLNEAVS